MSLEQRQVNKAITVISQLPEHPNIFFKIYSVVVFSHLSLQPLLPCTGSSNISPLQTSYRSAILENLNCHCRCIITWHLHAANIKSKSGKKLKKNNGLFALDSSEIRHSFLNKMGLLKLDKRKVNLLPPLGTEKIQHRFCPQSIWHVFLQKYNIFIYTVTELY